MTSTSEYKKFRQIATQLINQWGFQATLRRKQKSQDPKVFEPYYINDKVTIFRAKEEEELLDNELIGGDKSRRVVGGNTAQYLVRADQIPSNTKLSMGDELVIDGDAYPITWVQAVRPGEITIMYIIEVNK